MNLSLAGKVALVTGAGQGIGKAVALELARQGADVAVADINDQTSGAVAAEIHGLGRKAAAIAGDISQAEGAESAVDGAVKDLGRLDILVNNAGITRDGLLLRMSEADWDRVLAINLRGTFLCSKAAAKVMTKQRWGRIISVASVIGIRGNAGQANYAASKAGVIGLTKSLARELAGRNVTANAVAPGFIQTAMTDVLPDKVKEQILTQIPLGRMGGPEDVAAAIAFLASEAAGYITGQVLAIDGGMAM
ncbi:MAG: 3-oxoacyl-[acyl-carrier-protein] reductase [Candidatus Sumerlaeia bacterium]|nr:3-oxoacyl-[acyl-carrier-protein] reductase [Candidatus Sumerlaeia bacterium]